MTGATAERQDSPPEAAPVPSPGRCALCLGPVLRLLVDGRETLVERGEVVPLHECPFCHSFRVRGHQRRELCEACGNAGWIGTELPLRGVALGMALTLTSGDVTGVADGPARLWRRDEPLEPGEAVHRLHGCT